MLGEREKYQNEQGGGLYGESEGLAGGQWLDGEDEMNWKNEKRETKKKEMMMTMLLLLLLMMLLLMEKPPAVMVGVLMWSNE